MSYLKTLKTTTALIPLTLMSGTFATSSANAAEDVIVLEEIVVTAQHREQSLQDVPISVAVIGGDFIKRQSIDKMADLQFSVPNFTMAESGIGTNVFIRGIGSGNNQGFEQSVGIYVDGIHHGRAQQSRAPFLDIARIEVLRGPQSILFGKNSVAGALNITTARPTDEFEGSVSLSFEPTDDEKEATVVLSGPVSDKMRIRLAARYHTLDGYMENLTLGQNEPNQEDWTIRGTAEFDVNENLMATLKVERSEYNVLGRNIEIDGEIAAAAGPFTGLKYSQILGIFGQDASVANNTLDGKRHANGDFSNNTQTEIVFKLDWQMGDHSLTTTTGYSDFTFDDNCDCDFTGGNVFTLPLSEQYEQYSQEIRLTSPGGEKVDYILGAYFQTSKHGYQDAIEINGTSVLVPLLNGNPGFAPFAPLFALNGLTGAGDLFANTRGPREARVDADVYSAFAQVTWNISDRVNLQLGGRLTHETKEGFRNLTVTNLDGSALTGAKADLAPDFYGLAFDIGASNIRGAELGAEVLPFLTAVYTGILGPVVGPPTAAAVAGAFGAKADAVGKHPVSGSRTETKFSPDIKLTFDVSDDAMLYASWVKGSKSGGFDFRANNKGRSATMEEAFEFEDESATNYEVGGKLIVADGAAEINFAGFFTKFSDLQVSIFDGALGFNVGNAAKAEVYGFEVDGRWQATDSLTLNGSLAYTDFQFKDYVNGQCYFGQDPFGPSAENDDCDYSGLTQQLVSKWQATLGFNHVIDLSSDLTLNTSGNMFYTSEYHASAQLDPKLIQPGYVKLNARIGLMSESGWELAVLGENLTDKKVKLFAGDAPLSGSTFGAIANYNFMSRGRTITLQASMKF